MGEMLKKNWFKLIIASVITLAPILIGLILWDKLPLNISTHWGADGTADGSSGKIFAVFGLPLILLVMQWVCIFITALDKKNREQNSKVISMVLFIVPFISLFASGIIYMTALDHKLNVTGIMLAVMGLAFMVIGNYMPKCRQNSTIGVKIKWTLANEENWNATHRLTGRVWFIGGIVIIAMMFLPPAFGLAAFFLILAAMVAIPAVYSCLYYREQVKRGTAEPNPAGILSKQNKAVFVSAIIGTVILLAAVTVVCFTGDIDVSFGDTAFTVKASYFDDITVEYACIDSVEYRETDKAGVRLYGFNSPRLLMGTFKNDEFGTYTRYSFAGGDVCVVIKSGEDILVLGGETDAETLAIYDELLARMAE